MKHTCEITVESINVKFVTLKGIKVSASAEYNAEEMREEGNVFSQVVETLTEKFDWLAKLGRQFLEIDLKNKELLSESLKKQIADGKIEAFGPHGWTIHCSCKAEEQTEKEPERVPAPEDK